MKKKNKPIFKYLIIILSIGVLIYGLKQADVFKDYGPEEIKKYINSFGILSPVVYVTILTLLPLLFFPDSILVIAGGMIFGLTKGVVLTSVGSFLGASLSFYISRLLGQNIVARFMKNKSANLEKYSKKSGLLVILMLRLIPLFPFKVVSYSAGLSNVSFKDFTIATVIGSIPGIIVYTNLGDKSTEIGSSGFYMSIALVIFLFIVSFILKNKVNSRQTEDYTNEKRKKLF